MGYNQQSATTTEVCMNPGSTYCLEWIKTQEVTYNWFDTIALFFLAGVIIFTTRLFSKKKR